MIKEEFYFDSRDGESRIHAVRYTPDDGNVKGIVQVVHGMAEYVERYENLAEFLTARGILVTGEDHLGHGKSVAAGGTHSPRSHMALAASATPAPRKTCIGCGTQTTPGTFLYVL